MTMFETTEPLLACDTPVISYKAKILKVNSLGLTSLRLC